MTENDTDADIARLTRERDEARERAAGLSRELLDAMQARDDARDLYREAEERRCAEMTRTEAAESRAADEERQRTEAITRICGAFGITSALQLAALAERDDETTLDLIVKLIDRVHAAKDAAESRAARLLTVIKEIESKTGHFGEAPPPPEWMPMLSLIAWVGRIARAALGEGEE